MTHIIDRKDWADSPEEWKGDLECAAYGADVSLIFNLQAEPGGGPRLHRKDSKQAFRCVANESRLRLRQ